MDIECVRAIGKWLSFGRELGLHEKLCFSCSLVKSLIADDKTVRSFQEMKSVSCLVSFSLLAMCCCSTREIVEVLHPFVDTGEVFVSMFLQHPRTCCEDVLQQGGLGTRLGSGDSSVVVQVSSCIILLAF